MPTPTACRAITLATVLFCALVLSACAMRKPVPKAGTQVTSTSEVFRQTARGLHEDCGRIGGCTCMLDGVQTTCAGGLRMFGRRLLQARHRTIEFNLLELTRALSRQAGRIGPPIASADVRWKRS